MDNTLRLREGGSVGVGAHPFDLVGSTGIVVLINGSTMVCANVGDSRALLCRGSTAHALSEDHKPEAPAEVSIIHSRTI